MSFDEFCAGVEEPLDAEFVAAFISFAEETGINLDHHDDWGAWWKCFQAGGNAAG